MEKDNQFIGLNYLINSSDRYKYYAPYRSTNLSTDQILQCIIGRLDQIGKAINRREIIIHDQYLKKGFDYNGISFVYLKAAVRYDIVSEQFWLLLPEALFRYNGDETWSSCSKFSNNFLEKLGMIRCE